MEASGIQGTEWVDFIRGGAYEKWEGSNRRVGSGAPHPKTSPAATGVNSEKKFYVDIGITIMVQVDNSSK